jgi:single-stranded-DNA-specific exonuclease
MINIIKRDKNLNKEEVKKIARELKTTESVVSLLLNRGYEKEELYKYIQTDEFAIGGHDSITNSTEAAEIIAKVLSNDDAEIYVYGDYDCDGIMSTSIANGVLTAIKEALESKVNINIKVPNRFEGYGLSLDWCKKTFPKKVKKETLVMTVDNGITKYKEVEYLQSKGITVIITDHHAPKKGEVPDCLVVDPWLHDTDNENALGLCGASVAYKVFGRVLELFEADESFIFNYLPNATIATITDVMPTTQENVGIVGLGLWQMKQGFAKEALMYYRNYINKDISITDIGFDIGPQINACGRMGEIQLALDFMNAEDEDDLEDIYNHMVNLNDERKALEKNIYDELIKKDYSKDLFIVEHVANLGGVGGTVASKMISAYNKPVILLGGNGTIVHGSARSVEGLNLHELFKYEVEKGNMINFGGHHGAAGVIVDINKIDDLRQSLNELLMAIILTKTEAGVIEREQDITIEVDDIIELKDIKKATVKDYDEMLFFGTLKEPIFAIKNLDVLEARSSSNNPDHLCLNLEDNTCKAKKNRYGKMVGKEIWVWNKMNEYKRLGSPNKVHLIGKLVPDFRNPKYYTFSVEQIIPA